MSRCVPNWGVESSFLAAHKPPPVAAHTVYHEKVDLVPWFDGRAGEGKAVSTVVGVRDAVVPCAVSGEDDVDGVQVAPDSEGGCTRVGSCSGHAAWEFSRADDDGDEGSVNASSYARVPVAEEEEWSSEEGGSASLDMSDTFDGSRRVPTMSSSEREPTESLTTSFFSLDNTFSSSWRSGTNNTTPSNDNSSSSVFRSRKQRKKTNAEEISNKRGTSKSSSTKRSRCEADQKRREKIDERMKKLQRLVPNLQTQSTEKDKEWVLDEVIEQVQRLQAQLHQMMMMTMMVPMPVMAPMLQQLPHMPMMAMPMMQMGYRQNLALPACVFPGVVCLPTAYPQCQWRPTVEEAHSRMAAASLMQAHHQQFPFVFRHGNFF